MAHFRTRTTLTDRPLPSFMVWVCLVLAPSEPLPDLKCAEYAADKVAS